MSEFIVKNKALQGARLLPLRRLHVHSLLLQQLSRRRKQASSGTACAQA